uniref:SFRICE_030862 n=1 Tax=Spodoptera frugiperda TaxID=7108 RepID=A0A2H1WIP8_SPOFR
MQLTHQLSALPASPDRQSSGGAQSR